MGKSDSQNLSMAEAMRLANSKAGKQLLSQLQQNHGADLQQAMHQAAAGNYDQVRQAMSAAMQSPEIRAMLEQLRRQQNG